MRRRNGCRRHDTDTTSHGIALMSLDEVAIHKDDAASHPGDNSPVRWRLDCIVSKLRTSRDVTHNIRQDGPTRRAPSRDVLETVMNGLIEALFPRHYGQS